MRHRTGAPVPCSAVYRFALRPRWIAFHVLVVIVVVVMINLGFWQLRRLDQRQARNDAVAERSEQPAVPVEQLLAVDRDTEDADGVGAVEWRTVTASGRYDAAGQVVIRNRSFGGAPGYHVVTPLVTDGATLLVNRGWIPLGDDDGPDVPAPPVGSVDVTGRIRPSQQRSGLGPGDPADGTLTSLARVDVARIAAQSPGELYPAYVELVDADPAPVTPPERLPLPELSEGSHLSYAGQWFLFSAAALVAWVVVLRRAARQGGRFRVPSTDVPEDRDLPVG